MIRLTRPPCPSELTPQLAQKLAAKFLADGESVWNKPFIRAALRTMSNGKCAFCECKLEEESKYLEVEHFAPKTFYPDKVMSWDNFLPACRRCNGSKSSHDVLTTPIINPANEDPRDHLTFTAYRFYGKDDKGRSTLDVLSLNDTDRLMLNRFKVGNLVLETLQEIENSIREYRELHGDVRSKNKILNKLRAIMRQGLSTEEYSAVVATVIMHDSSYSFIKSRLEVISLWDAELTNLDSSLRAISYQ